MQTNYVSLAIALVAALNGAAISFGLYHLNDAQLESVDKIISLGFTIWGIFKSHQTPQVQNQNENTPA